MRALITGVTGQDGYYLSELLKSKGYRVFGGYRRGSKFPDGFPDVDPVPIEMTEHESVRRAITSCLVDEIYNLAAQSHVGESFNCPVYTHDVNGAGPVRILEVIRGTKVKLYQASTSEMFGDSPPPQNELTAFSPQSPYAASKLYAHQMCNLYRKAYGVRVSCGILFNHESPRRGRDFVTRKITWNLAKKGRVTLGNLDALRDWGHARDYMEAAWMMLQHTPGDFVIGTGEMHSVREFLGIALKILGGEAKVDPALCRPADVPALCADASRAREVLGWRPKTGFRELVEEMCRSDGNSPPLSAST